MTRDALVIMFGAGGRLGTQLLPLLTESVTVLGIARQNKPTYWPRRMRWMQLDITDPEEWPDSLCFLTDIASSHQCVVCVDLLLHRATVAAMRNSITAVTTYILYLRDKIAVNNRPCSLVAANTTAALAPWLYQTPYGLAKRHQLARYVASGITGTALLLPSLIDTHNNETMRNKLTWTYREAAEHVAVTVTRHAVGLHRRDLRVVVPSISRRLIVKECLEPTNLRWAMKRLVPAHVDLVLNRRDSPQAHREASHNRLALTPRWLRDHLDHHRVPQLLVRRLCRSLNVSTETCDSIAEQPTRK